MRIFRKVIFWLHLCLALSAGVVIFIMCATGAMLAFERNIIELAESDVRTVAVDVGKRRSPLEVLGPLMRDRPDLDPTALAISSDPGSTWSVSLGREGQIFVDPYTGAVLGEGNNGVRSVMSKLRSWHRYIALSGDSRQAGKLATGISNIIFLFLAISGVYLWFPRKLEWKRFQPVIWFRRGLKGKGRNFNWHNVIGFWTSLFLIVFTLTATVISF
ncbi:MAG: PepSY-associated TM helix domain-containing protein, partial [Acidobacteriota bacterium]